MRINIDHGDSVWTRQQYKGSTMFKIDELKTDIERLPSEEHAKLFRWLSEKHWDGWDKENQADSQAGKLDFLVRDAARRKRKGISRICECIAPPLAVKAQPVPVAAHRLVEVLPRQCSSWRALCCPR